MSPEWLDGWDAIINGHMPACALSGTLRSKGAPFQLRPRGTGTHAAGFQNDELQASMFPLRAVDALNTSRSGKRFPVNSTRLSALPDARMLFSISRDS
ncbi:hypothetical protein CCMA1212_002817 [Trichoderma ghanense]|uniref:Uncharacterized protein n=1 Tax=Trichoderma ghanense TaxID=65468 RepID=A0ABY2HDG1_9HYPO